jgi:hypothetical protein
MHLLYRARPSLANGFEPAFIDPHSVNGCGSIQMRGRFGAYAENGLRELLRNRITGNGCYARALNPQ